MSGSDVIIVAIIAFVIGSIFGNFVQSEAIMTDCTIQAEFRKGAKVFDCVERKL